MGYLSTLQIMCGVIPYHLVIELVLQRMLLFLASMAIILAMATVTKAIMGIAL